ILGGGGAPTAAEASLIQQLGKTNRMKVERFRRDDCEILAPYGGFIPGMDLYTMLRTAAEVFLLLRCGICPPDIDREAGEPGALLEDGVFGSPAADELDPQELQDRLTTFLGEDRRSYIRAIILNVFQDSGLGLSPFAPISVGFGPCLIELIWSFWH